VAKKQPEPKQGATKHRVLQNLRHDGKHYNPKSVVELTAEEAKPLVAAKVVAPILTEEK
jgi:hypothetical protein